MSKDADRARGSRTPPRAVEQSSSVRASSVAPEDDGGAGTVLPAPPSQDDDAGASTAPPTAATPASSRARAAAGRGEAPAAVQGRKRKPRRCKDCPEGIKRPAPHPGPRCATHHRTETKRAALAAHERRVSSTYGLDDYWSLYRDQGGRCAICRWSRGISKRLAVDHDHRTGQVRGLLCSGCNTFIGRMRDNPEAFERAAHYLRRWQ